MKDTDLIQKYSDSLKASGKSIATIKKYIQVIRSIQRKLQSDLTHPNITEIIQFCSQSHLKPSTLHAHHNVLKLFYRWCEEEEIILIDPMLKVPAPKYVKGLPTKIMTKGETEKMLNSIPVEEGNYFSYRDRLIMELLYSCSLRRGEVVALNVIDYDRSTKSLRIRANTSKSNQGRLLPVGSIASSILEHYIDHIHQSMHREALFLNYRKERLSVQHVTRLVTKLRKKLKLKTQATSHSFRKSSATHMLRNSAPLVSVSRLLGHTDISATQLYTKVYPVDIVKMQKAHHPREKQKNQKLPVLKIPSFLYEQSNLTVLKHSEKVFKFHKTIVDNHPRERDELPILRPF